MKIIDSRVAHQTLAVKTRRLYKHTRPYRKKNPKRAQKKSKKEAVESFRPRHYLSLNGVVLDDLISRFWRAFSPAWHLGGRGGACLLNARKRPFRVKDVHDGN